MLRKKHAKGNSALRSPSTVTSLLQPNFLSQRNDRTFSCKKTSLMQPPSEYEQPPHSKIPTCMILNIILSLQKHILLIPFIRSLKPVKFIFPFIIIYALIQVSNFLKSNLHSGCLLKYSSFVEVKL